MNQVVPRLMYIQNYIDRLEEHVDQLTRKGYSTNHAIEIVKLAYLVQDGEARDESIYDIGLAIEDLSTTLAKYKNGEAKPER